jgi:NDP-sugar pyrophosphorylase family protein
MNALVLAAGRGTRLRPLSDSAPGPLIGVAGIVLLHDVLSHLASCDVSRVVLNGSLDSEVLERSAAGKCRELDIEMTFQHEPELLGTAGAARRALPLLGDPFAVIYGNVLSRQPLHSLLDMHLARKALLTLSLCPTGNPHEKSVVITDPEGAVTGIRMKPPPEEAETNLALSGTFICSKSALEHLEDGESKDFDDDVVRYLLSRGRMVAAEAPGGYSRCVSTPENLLLACYEALSGAVEPWSLPRSEDGRLVEGTIHPGTIIEGVLWSKTGSVIESGSYLENCVVMERAVVKGGVRLKNAIVLPDSRIESGTCCDDKYLSVLGKA